MAIPRLHALALLSLLVLMAASLGCRRDSGPDKGSGVPAAGDWAAPAPQRSRVEREGESAPAPQAGMGGQASDPHAGMNMGGSDPHAGMGGGPGMGLSPPDPDREVDASKFLRGKIVATDKTRDHIAAGAVLFLAVRPIDPLTGEIIGSPIAVDRIDVDKLPVEFDLSGHKAMSGGTQFQGDVIINARIDGDGDAGTKEPGDIVGELKAKIPAKGLELKLDSRLR